MKLLLALLAMNVAAFVGFAQDPVAPTCDGDGCKVQHEPLISPALVGKIKFTVIVQSQGECECDGPNCVPSNAGQTCEGKVSVSIIGNGLFFDAASGQQVAQPATADASAACSADVGDAEQIHLSVWVGGSPPVTGEVVTTILCPACADLDC